MAGAHDAVGILHLHLAALVGAHGAERLVLTRGRLGHDNGRGTVSQLSCLAHAHCGGGTYLNGAFGGGDVGVTFSAGGEQRTGCDGTGDEGCAAGEDARRRISFCGIDCGVDGCRFSSRGGACLLRAAASVGCGHGGSFRVLSPPYAGLGQKSNESRLSLVHVCTGDKLLRQNTGTNYRVKLPRHTKCRSGGRISNTPNRHAHLFNVREIYPRWRAKIGAITGATRPVCHERAPYSASASRKVCSSKRAGGSQQRRRT